MSLRWFSRRTEIRQPISQLRNAGVGIKQEATKRLQKRRPQVGIWQKGLVIRHRKAVGMKLPAVRKVRKLPARLRVKAPVCGRPHPVMPLREPPHRVTKHRDIDRPRVLEETVGMRLRRRRERRPVTVAAGPRHRTLIAPVPTSFRRLRRRARASAALVGTKRRRARWATKLRRRPA